MCIRDSCRAYERDVEHFAVFLNKRDVGDLYHAVNADVVSYLMELKNLGRSKSTVNRKLASIRTYYGFLQKTQDVYKRQLPLSSVE